MRSLLMVVVLSMVVGCGMSSTSAARFGGGGSSTIGEGAAGTLTAGIWDDSLNFELFTAYRDGQQGARLAELTPEEQAAAATETRGTTSALDVAFVVDTTGSMGDEIGWLKAEIKQLAADISAAHPNVPTRWGLVHYRDVGDDYVTRHVDFTTSVTAYQTSLDGLAPGGGGDFPEAPAAALAKAGTLQWGTAASTAKLIFWVADAPPHDNEAGEFTAAVRGLKSQGVHVYPVASSGIDERTEYAMRAAAQLTLGRYIFLTDDSGVGGQHKEPTIPCYVVSKLNHAIERSIDSELAGTRVELDPTKVIRSVGAPVDGKCSLDSGVVAHLF
ncbi:MAG: VWA domain-containing protein [Myxococcaceae bacterium]|nr:VWA domain-containing protein [Myxococcaceae bacterium]